MLHRLAERGVEAALDDFGTGYSSLGHVHQFPLKMIKIDQSFVAPFANGVPPRSSAVIEAILALGNALGTEIVAEGIETDAQWAVLRAMGCVYGQGYRFARPRPPAIGWDSETRKGDFRFIRRRRNLCRFRAASARWEFRHDANDACLHRAGVHPHAAQSAARPARSGRSTPRRRTSRRTCCWVRA